MSLQISLAQWSLHRTIFAGDLHPLHFPAFARDTFGIGAVEYVNRCFKDHYADDDPSWVGEIAKRCGECGVQSLLIMVDRQGDLGDSNSVRRHAAVRNHHKWIEAAKVLGCHSIRVNARTPSNLPPTEQAKLAVDGLSQLTSFAAEHGINVLVENHGGLSSNGAWLASVIEQVNEQIPAPPGQQRCGTLPDFGNFCMDWDRKEDSTVWYDRYQGVAELMPFAKAVSAKSHDFDEPGNEVHTDFHRMMKIVHDAGYRGSIGIEYEGAALDELTGVQRTLELLQRITQSAADGEVAEGAFAGYRERPKRGGID